MKHRVFLAVALMFAMALATNAAAQQYDFSAVASTGQTLYYRITDSSTHTVAVTHPATGTGINAWNGYTKPTGSLAIPDTVLCNSTSYTVDTVDEYAFYECSGLTSVIIPNSVTSIGEGAFKSCSRLTSISIPNLVTSIGYYAFKDCYGLTSITIPHSVTSIGNEAFSSCRGLTSIVVESGNTCYDSRNSCNAIIETATNTLIQGCKNTIIPNSVTYIGGSAFYGCSDLTSITIPNSVTSIGSLAFSDCIYLTSIVVVSGNTHYDSRNSCNAIIETATNTLIQGCKNTIIPNSVTSIGDYAFGGCSRLTQITIPNSVTSIGESAFRHCSGLTSVTIPGSVTSIGSSVFSGCYGLTSVTIPNSVTSIGDYAFYSCSGLTSVTIPNLATSIGNYAFTGCSGLTSVTIPDSVTSIGESAFSWCSGLTSVTIPNSVTSIGNYAFGNCSRLISVTIPNSVTSIGEYAFYNCSGLTSITSLSTVPPTIEYNTFIGVTTTIPLFVPCGTEAAYRAANYWNSFQNIQCSGTTITACDSYTWHGNTYTTSGMYIDGNDTLYLTVNYNSNASETMTACDSYTWNNHGSVYTHIMSGTYYNRYATAEGCASVDTLYLTVNYNSNASETMTACDYYSWSDHDSTLVYTVSGVYYNSYLNAEGCASVDTLYLTVNYNSSASETMTACDSYTWNNHGNSNVCTERGTYFSSYNTADGCQSVDTLYLTIAHHSGNSEVITAYDSYTWNNHGSVNTFTVSGAFYNSYTNADGCPSIDTLYLTINHRADTIIIHDTTILTHTDTVIVTNTIHDTVTHTQYVTVHDTMTLRDTITQTQYVTTHDTVYVNICDNDTITLRDTITLTQYEITHDTTVFYNGETVYDTLYTTIFRYLHDTTYIDHYFYDTTVVNNYIHDTSVIYTTIHDTVRIIRNILDYVYDTIYQQTTVYVHDTLIVDHYIHDTTILTSYIHDTLFVNHNIHDTVFITNYIHDTAFVNNYIHDTTYITNTIHDTTFITNQVHDTTIVDNYIHDTAYIAVHDTLYLYLHDTVYIHDTIYINGEGIEGASVIDAKVYSSNGHIVVEGADGNAVTLYDITGRLLATRRDEQEPLRFDVPASGAYLIKIGHLAARKVVVIK